MIVAFRMWKIAFTLLLLAPGKLSLAAPPAPKEHLGFAPGDDYKLAGSEQIYGYFRKLAASSPRVRLVEFGRSAGKRPMYAAFISSEENLNRLDRFREISRRLALGQATADEARRLAGEGRAIVWIDSGLHASEVAPAQHAPELAYRMVAGESEELARIRRNVILIQIPVINPDGLDMVAGWYSGNAGTRFETAPLPWLYHKYAGHDNNRDWFMLNLVETRQVTRLLFAEWFPQIVYNQHQSPAFPARIFVPPYADPLNPHIPAGVMEGINLIGMAIRERMARENKPGVLSSFGFDAWWNGGLRSSPAFHNMHGILTETAGYSYATPRDYSEADIPPTFAGGLSTREPSMNYQRPWMGGRWRVRDAIDYMLTADLAILNLAASRCQDFLLKSWEMARASIEVGRAGNPFAYILPPDQWDPITAVDMLERLSLAGVEVRRAKAELSSKGKTWPEGTWVLPAAQPFRPYLVDLMEPQKYPGTKRPYDVAGWTLPLMMGVTVQRVDQPFDIGSTEPCAAECLAAARRPAPDHRQNHAFLLISDLLQRGAEVGWAEDGAILTGQAAGRAAYRLRRPKVALYQPWLANIDAGWTEWLLDHYRIPHALLHNDDIRKGGLRSRFDSLILASQSAMSILNGTRDGESPASRGGAGPPVLVQRPEYTGGIGIEGLLQLDRFVREGGTLIAFDTAAELPVQFFPLSIRNPVRGSSFSCPGSLLRLSVDASHPLAFGMPKEAIAFSTGGTAFEIALAGSYNTGDHEIRSVAQFADSQLLASGWIAAPDRIQGKPALLEARHGNGRVVLFGFRPQFRGQTFGTFKFLLNAIYRASAK